ncbi:MaoC/PaaZ C-terminal domain-containing protein [Paraburkholderia sp.]|uniref:MaoC/PaaZ C-terminal domain-containing protein n=1 Tax=Paraburkholderia sp. TaxID=1926495 RepID=UPI0039E33F29
MFDQWYDDLSVGDRKSYRGVTMTEAHIVNFAGVTGDWNPKHVDAEFARNTPLGQRVPHGLLLLSSALARAPIDPDRILRFLGLDAVRFITPAFIGDTIHPVLQVIAREDAPSGGTVRFRLEVVSQKGEVLLTAELSMLFASRLSQ